MGGLAVGGGALLGSGAFTSTSAERDVEVNVMTGTDIGNNDQIADVLVNVGGFDTVAVDDGNGTVDETTLFPTTSSSYSNPSYGKNWVSVIENDVTIVFGTSSNKLPPNSTSTFDNLFALVNSNGSPTSLEHSLSFDNSGFTQTDSEVTFQNPPSGVAVPDESSYEYGVDVTTDDSDETATPALQITID